MKIKKAFTLAEVLITLSIIGVVAALTIPSLIVKNQEKQTVVQLKKAYSVYNNAFTNAVADYGSPESWGLVDSSNVDVNGNPDGTHNPMGGENMANILKNYLNVVRDCKSGSGCFANGIYKKYDGSDDRDINNTTLGSKLVLADGTSIELRGLSPQCTRVATRADSNNEALKHICGSINVDLNGTKPPNTSGKDLFGFYVTKNSVIPKGLPDETGAPLSECKTKGWGCAAWVLMKENLDYPNNWD